MTRLEFLEALKSGLKGLPQEDIEERVSFYREMIDDRIEDGISEQEAISEIGTVENVISQIVADIPITKIVKQKISSKSKLRAWEIVLLILGSPIWLSLLIAFLAVVFALYVSIWSVIVSLWAAFGSLIACGVGSIIGGVVLSFTGNALSGLLVIGAGLVCTGLSILFFYGCNAVTKGILMLTKKVALSIKNTLLGKEEA